jgi:hypothetical protein
MKQYALSTYQPDAAPPRTTDMARIARDVAALQHEMKDAGVCVFTDHLQPSSATVVRATLPIEISPNLPLCPSTTSAPTDRGRRHGMDLIGMPM